jgi:hypothetical protein
LRSPTGALYEKFTGGFTQIWRANADGTNQTNISGPTDSVGFPAWSPRP